MLQIEGHHPTWDVSRYHNLERCKEKIRDDKRIMPEWFSSWDNGGLDNPIEVMQTPNCSLVKSSLGPIS
jgi:hypothetical protein